MSKENDWKYLARKTLVDGALEKITECKEFGALKTQVYCEIAKLGNQIDAKNEGLFSDDLWASEKNREKIIELVKAFLWRCIK
ncbi:MAG: hypothetical protein ACFFD2_16595 [Promethearchaeota archaeon]